VFMGFMCLRAYVFTWFSVDEKMQGTNCSLLEFMFFGVVKKFGVKWRT